MHAHRPNSDRPAVATEPMRDEDVRRMLAARSAHTRGGRRRPLRRMLIRLSVLLALYVLSIGPLYWKWYGAKVGLGSPLFLLLYRPLELFARWFAPLGHFLNWYIGLWIY
jgi:hypothetical protein